MAAKTYEVTWVSSTGDNGRKIVPASSLGAALNQQRHYMNIARGGAMYESITLTVTRVS